MNIVYIHTHDTGCHISPYGYKMPTPNLQRLAENGTLFRQAFTTSPTCSPSRSAMMTGRSAHQSGMLGLAHHGFKLTDPSRHLPFVLKAHGYETILCGVQHEFHSAPEQMDEVYSRAISAKYEKHFQWDIDNAANVASFLRERSKDDAPFFLSYGLFSTHRDFVEADPSDFNPANIHLPEAIPDTPETRKDMADYAATVEIADDCVGRVLEGLRSSDISEDTVIVFSTDHGLPLPGMKCNLTDSGMGISLIIDWPGNPAKGQAIDSMVTHLDLFPTFFELANLEPPKNLQGKSLLPLLNGEKTALHDAIYGEVTFHAAYEPMRCIRTERYKLIRVFDEDLRRPAANCDDSPARRILIEAGWLDNPRPELRLHDLVLDPLEQQNLAYDPNFLSLRTDLEERLSIWMEETEDPLLNGVVPRPHDSVVCTREAIDVDGPYEEMRTASCDLISE